MEGGGYDFFSPNPASNDDEIDISVNRSQDQAIEVENKWQSP